MKTIEESMQEEENEAYKVLCEMNKLTVYTDNEREEELFMSGYIVGKRAGAKAKQEMDVELLKEAFSAGALLAAYYSGDPVKKPSFDTLEQWLQQKKP